jgi:UDP-2,3-diacylglucosamine pyrophosphatase LpxH
MAIIDEAAGDPVGAHSFPARRYRSIWLSDIHLGTRGCKAEFLLDFLRHNDSDYLYLVGDIVDGWRLRKSWYWTQGHNDVVQKLLRKARKGTKVVYIPGNHDEWLRDYTGLQAGGITLLDETEHVTADGRRLLIIHGDNFDGIVRYSKWLALLGDWAYSVALTLNTYFNLARRRLGYSYWSLSAYLKGRVKNAVQFMSSYAHMVSDQARSRGFDGIVCGHIHKAEIKDIDGILYCNDGDWVESCTALVEHFDGKLEIIHWMEERALDPLYPRAVVTFADGKAGIAGAATR